MPLPPGVCPNAVCWDLTYNFAACQVRVMKPADVPNWNKGALVPVNMFPQQVAQFQARLNAQAKTLCGNTCVCFKLHKKAINFRYEPMKIGPHPAGVTDLYLEGVTARGWMGLCLAKGWVRIGKGGKWIPVEDLDAPDVIKEGSSSSPGGGGKKKGKKAGRRVRRRR